MRRRLRIEHKRQVVGVQTVARHRHQHGEKMFAQEVLQRVYAWRLEQFWYVHMLLKSLDDRYRVARALPRMTRERHTHYAPRGSHCED